VGVSDGVGGFEEGDFGCHFLRSGGSALGVGGGTVDSGSATVGD